MIKYVCDMCDKSVQTEQHLGKVSVSAPLAAHVEKGCVYDLCEGCFQSLRRDLTIQATTRVVKAA